jgi:hypothetical protein
MRKVTITKKNGSVGVLVMSSDGRWDIFLNGVAAPGNNYYDTEQVERIISTAKSNGELVEIE